MKTIVTDIALEIAHRDHAPCPTHEGMEFSKSTGGCSCGSSHSLQELYNARLRDHRCPMCGGPMREYRTANNSDPGDVDSRADCLNRDCGWGY